MKEEIESSISPFDTANAFCRIVADVMAAHGVQDVVCSPGSRNTPILIAVASRKEFKSHVVVDERSAAFIALGIAQVSGRPVALVCTSGTALLNYAPAVAEAYYQGLPLIVISADRPEPWIDQDDSQTIRQQGALTNFVKQSYDLPAISSPDKEMNWYANRIVNDAMLEALSSRRGPVHLNLRLAPPLGKRIEKSGEECRVIRMIKGETSLNREKMNKLAAEALSRKVLIVAGFMPPSSRLNKAFNALLQMPNVVVMAETLSNLHLPTYCYRIDSVFCRDKEAWLPENAPDLVISVGGAIVSRKIKEYLRGIKGVEHWAVGFQHTTVDCFQSLSLRIEASSDEFFMQLSGRMRKLSSKGMKVSVSTSYKRFWDEARYEAIKSLCSYEKEISWSDFMAYGKLLSSLPSRTNLYLSNGTSVRYAQLFPSNSAHASYCNRGVSGIDGSTSTAIGGSMTYKGGMSLLVTGDMSFSYDIGALQLRETPDSMRIAVVSNGGGGIFRFIGSTSELPAEELLNPYFCADPKLNVKAVSEAFGWKYLKADSQESLDKVLPQFFNPDSGKTILEIITPPELSARILTEYLSFPKS